MKTTWTK